MSSKAQFSLEFIMVFSFVLVIFVGFMYIFSHRISDAVGKQDDFEMQNLADSIKNEVILATQVHEAYIRRFEIPLALNGQDYTIKLLPEDGPKEFLEINLTASQKHETYMLPYAIKGQFLDIEADALDYCVAKGKTGGTISISKNQLELAPGFVYDGSSPTQLNVNQVPSNTDISLLVNANCIENFQQASFKVNFKEGFEYVGQRRAHNHEEFDAEAYSPSSFQNTCSQQPTAADNCDIYGDEMFGGSDKDAVNKPLNKAYVTITECPTTEPNCIHVTISHKGPNGPSGSDSLIELVFKSNNLANQDTAYLFEIKEADIVDSRIRYVPPSMQGISITLV